MSRIEQLKTYENKKGEAIIRRCGNCIHWNNQIKPGVNVEGAGFCKRENMFFAMTLEPTVFPITRDFYMCEHHVFKNEEVLKANAPEVSLYDVAIKNRKPR